MPGKNPKDHLVPLYASAMTDAIASDDMSQMEEMRNQALDQLAAAAEIEKMLPELDKAINARGGVIRPLYGVTIQDALAKGDPAEVARLRAEVSAYAKQLPQSVSQGTPTLPYGIAIQDAKARGDDAEVERLTRLAESLMAQLNDK